MFLKERDHSRQSNPWEQRLGFWRPRVHEGNYITHNSKSVRVGGGRGGHSRKRPGRRVHPTGEPGLELVQQLGILDKEGIEFHLCFKNIIVESVWKEN